MLRQILAALGLLALTACAQAPVSGFPRGPDVKPNIVPAERDRGLQLLDKLVGHWVVTGVIAGQNVVHDVDAQWVLQGNYVHISEISRERGANGQPSYEAAVYVGWLKSSRRSVCLWLDNTEVASGGVTCDAQERQDSLPFEFRDHNGALFIATTFDYHRDDDTWTWRIDNVREGRAVPFANLSLRRR